MNKYKWYDQPIKPIKQIILLNTIVFIFFGIYYSLYVSKFPWFLSSLFISIWFLSSCNQGFILKKTNNIYRFLDFTIAIILSMFLIYRSYKVIKITILVPLILIALILLLWQLISNNKSDFIFRVQLWHMYCGILLIFMIKQNIC